MDEEAINTLKVILEEATETEDSICYVTSGDTDALKAAIKALEDKGYEQGYKDGYAKGLRGRSCVRMTNEEAIEYLFDIKTDAIYNITTEEKEAINMAIKALEIELLTDTEQRIFLKAMSRAREICQKIDNQFLDDDSTVSLVKVCNSIERKVKKIWE